MKIKSLRTRNWKGLPGENRVDFPGKINFLLAKNGEGKTSYITALMYAITGIEPADMTHMAADGCAVQIDTAKGSYMRSRKRGKNAVYYVSDNATGKMKKASARELTERITAECGGDLNAAKILTSSELLMSINSKDFGDLVIKYLPELMDRETVISKVTRLTPLMKEIMEKRLPDGEFGAEELEKFFAFLTEERREAKKQVSQLETEIRVLGGVPATNETAEQLTTHLSELQTQRDSAVVYSQQRSYYEQIKGLIERNNAALRSIEEELKTLTAPKHTAEERQQVLNVVTSSQEVWQSALDAFKTDKDLHNTLVASAKEIGQNTCPLSDKIKCTSDKSCALDDLRTRANSICQEMQRLSEEVKKAKASYTDAKAKLETIDRDNAVAARREQLEAERSRIISTMPDMPEKPEQGPDMAYLNTEIEAVRKKLQGIENGEKARKANASLTEKKALRDALEELYSSFSPKGEVKQSLTRLYLDNFSEPLNEKVRYMFPNMKIKFESSDGVKILVDSKGIDQYIPLGSLSGGEQIAVVFLLMLVFGELSGLRVIIMDELSVLDVGVLEGLLLVMDANKDAFDLALLAAASHDDTLQIVESHNIPIISL